MATPLKPNKPLARETAAQYRGRPLIIELHPGYLEIREKGRRNRVTLDYRTALEVGYKILWRQQQADKKAAKAVKRGRP
jgi:hypothetical protein